MNWKFPEALHFCCTGTAFAAQALYSAAQASYLLHKRRICCRGPAFTAHLYNKIRAAPTGTRNFRAFRLLLYCTGTAFLLHKHCMCCTGTAFLLHRRISGTQASHVCRRGSVFSCTGAVVAALAPYLLHRHRIYCRGTARRQ